jgi:hypothetical protein
VKLLLRYWGIAGVMHVLGFDWKGQIPADPGGSSTFGRQPSEVEREAKQHLYMN